MFNFVVFVCSFPNHVSYLSFQEKALTLSLELGHDDFSASNGWLESFLKRHNMNLKDLCGESGDVPADVVDDWVQRIPDIVAGYDPKDIFNADETGLCFRALPSKTYAIKGDPCKGTKSAKDRITVLLACSAAGEKLTPLVIGKSAKPRCFKGREIMPVTYRHNRKAWMSSVLFTEWIDKLNNSMIRQKRKILLLLDNCAAHPSLVRSNVKCVFLPPNTTSKLQPCDAGIIQTVKLHYRKRFLRHVISEMEEAETATELCKSVTIRDAICWLDIAWNEGLKESTIMKCFRKCGYKTPLDNAEPGTSQAATSMESDIDAGTQEPAQELGPRFQRLMDGVSWEEYGQCDRNLITSLEEDEEPVVAASEDKPDSDDEENGQPPIPIIDSKTARYHVNDLLDYAFSAGCPAMIKAVRELESVMQDYKLKQSEHAPQKSIRDFFQGVQR